MFTNIFVKSNIALFYDFQMDMNKANVNFIFRVDLRNELKGALYLLVFCI